MSEQSLPPEEVLGLDRRQAGQSLHGYVRTQLAKIELLLRSGLHYEQIVQAMRNAGFEALQGTTVRTAVFRARKERESSHGAAPTAGSDSTATRTVAPRPIANLEQPPAKKKLEWDPSTVDLKRLVGGGR